jgi:hypothetical protein
MRFGVVDWKVFRISKKERCPYVVLEVKKRGQNECTVCRFSSVNTNTK